MVAINNSTSLTFLKDELDSNLNGAERALEAWSEDHSRQEELTRCEVSFSQLRGIFQILELPAASMMAEEMATMVATLPSVENATPRTEALSQAILLLARYLEYVQLKNTVLPELLIGGLNDLRRAAGKPLIQESHFFSLDLSRNRFPDADKPETDPADVPRLARRLRHMYQVGLLGVLRGESSAANLKLMARALTRLDRLCGPVPLGRLWWVGRGALEAMVTDQMALTPARKSLLAQIDRQIKRIVYDGPEAMQGEAPLVLLKEAVYVISLCSRSADVVGEVKQVFDLRQGISDEYLQGEIALMSGGGDSVVRSVAVNLKEELNSLKQALDFAAQGVSDTDYSDVANELMRIAGTLTMVKLDKEASQVRERADQVRDWKADQVDLEGVDFQQLVDDLLIVENAVATLERRVAPGDDVHKEARNKGISLYQLDAARMTVVQECRAGLALTKRAVSSFVDNNWDRMHLSSLPGTLAGVVGGLTFLELDRSRAVLDACRSYIEQTLLAAHSEDPTREHMDTLADAITSVDYYLESMEENKPIGDSVLEVAEESMHELGYPVVRAAAP